MPMPKPKDGESKDDFLSRCMGSDMMNDDYPDNDQRYAVCNTLWDKKDENAMPGDYELRTFGVEIRASDDPDAEPVIQGTAAVYNSPSELLFGQFTEVIEPGFFDGVLKNDVRALWNHNADLVLGRTKSGTLTLEDTERGLDFTIKPPDTQIGRDAVTSIKRRDVDQMSFAFDVKPGGDEWIRNKDGSVKRVLKRGGCATLYDVSPVTYPAYAKTSAYVRSKLEGFTAESQAASDGANEKAKAQARNANRKRKLQLLKLK